MNYLSVAQIAARWNLSERSVRNYCAHGQIPGAFLTGKAWSIPEDAQKPARKNEAKGARGTLLAVLRAEKAQKAPGGIYHKVQIELTYNSNHIEGSRLTHDQTRYIFETSTIGVTDQNVNVDDIVETVNHFQAIDTIIDSAERTLNERLILELHRILKSGTTDSRKGWFNVGGYKRFPNEVGGMPTTLPEDVPSQMRALLASYQQIERKSLEDILDFHVRFERIHPFQDGNGRVGRLILFKECLKNGIVPFIIEDELKLFYYRGLAQWQQEKRVLLDTCLTAQDRFKRYLAYFRIEY